MSPLNCVGRKDTARKKLSPKVSDVTANLGNFTDQMKCNLPPILDWDRLGKDSMGWQVL